MLTLLSVANFGLIDYLEVEFHDKLNVLTGETGAGKSIVIGALRSALGQKMDISQLRLPDKACVIEAVFDLSRNELSKNEVLKDYLEEDDPTLVIQRTLMPDARNRVKINGRAVNLGQLRAIGNFLMDFHGPHDHQMLLLSESHLGLLDQLCDFGSSKEKFLTCFKEYSEVKNKIDEISALTQTRERELDLLGHQIKDLMQVPLDQESYDEIEQQKIKVDNAFNLNEAANAALNYLDEGEQSSGETIRQCFSHLSKLNRLDEKTCTLTDELSRLQDMHDSLISNLREYCSSLQFDEQQALHVQQQSDLYDNILRKYGPLIEDARIFYDQAKERFELLSNLEGNDHDLRLRLKTLEKMLSGVAVNITNERKKKARDLKKTIEKELKALGIAHVQFEVKITREDFRENGWDKIEFYISPNAGIELKPMASIVSSGEAARVMLALKKALIAVDPIPVLVFDEIDAQIGGRLGTITGEKLRDIAQYRQVILITHLPRIASFGDHHFKVLKSVKNARSLTELIQLNDKERVTELAQMMSGAKETAVSLRHAKDMLQAACS